MHAKYEVSTSNGSKVIANVKVDNRQTDRQTNRQTNRQDKNNMPPIIRSGGIKIYKLTVQPLTEGIINLFKLLPNPFSYY